MHSSRFVAVFSIVVLLLPGAIRAQSENWSEASPVHRPPARSHAAMAADEVRGVIVLFGGLDSSGTSILGDTWEWDGEDWREVQIPTPPPARRSHAMAYDPLRRRVVLFGGVDLQSAFADTWEYDGSAWTRRHAGSQNDGRSKLGMAFDPIRGMVLRFGGYGTGGSYGDTRAWTGSQWILLGAGGPEPRSAFAMATDVARSSIVLFGGHVDFGPNVGRQGDTWLWDGASWRRSVTATTPPARSQFGMAFDASTARMVVFGGESSGLGPYETWAFDGADWSRRTTVRRPPFPQLQPAMACLRGRDQVVLLSTDGATWIYDAPILAPASWTTIGEGCPGGGGVPHLDAIDDSLPFLGAPFRVAVEPLGSSPFVLPFCIVGFSDAAWAGHPLPLALSLIGLPACTLYTDIAVAEPMVRSGARATRDLWIPRDSALTGRDFWVQALIVDAMAPGGAATSNAGRGRIGAR